MFRSKRQNARSRNIPAPVKGWNARDPIAQMDELFAVNFENWWVEPSYCMVRKGHTAHATGLPSTVESIFTYNGVSSSKMFAASNGGIYDVTSAGAVGAAVSSGHSSNYWNYVNTSNTAGNFLTLCNGADSVLQYNGSTWSNPSITGVTSSSLTNVTAHMRRMWFVEKNSMSAWYLAADAVSGSATEFDFGPVFKKGGYIVAQTSWTIDAGEGMDDHLVTITSEGEVAVYKGTDPSSANTWSIAGVYSIGSPIGDKCFKKFGGDVAVITKDGIIPLSAALVSDRTRPQIALTDNIQMEIAKETNLYGSLSGWEIMQFPEANMLLLNVPLSATTSEQYAMNLITGAWSGTWTGIDALCWALLNNQPYFGGNGIVNKFWDGYNDNGSNIDASALQAFTYIGKNTQEKFVKLARPTIQTSGNVTGFRFGVNVDFETALPADQPTIAASTFAVWDTAVWDTALWGGDVETKSPWSSIGVVGYAFAPHTRAITRNVEIRWLATSIIYEDGGFI